MRPRGLFLFLYALSGLAALVYEVAWSRLLALHLGHTVAAVSTVLAAFMGGLAAGAALAGFVLLPAVGLRLTTAGGMALNGIVAAGAWWLSGTIEAVDRT